MDHRPETIVSSKESRTLNDGPDLPLIWTTSMEMRMITMNNDKTKTTMWPGLLLIKEEVEQQWVTENQMRIRTSAGHRIRQHESNVDHDTKRATKMRRKMAGKSCGHQLLL